MCHWNIWMLYFLDQLTRLYGISFATDHLRRQILVFPVSILWRREVWWCMMKKKRTVIDDGAVDSE